MRALPDPCDVEIAYKRAVQADPANACILLPSVSLYLPVAVMRALPDPCDVEIAYKRAVQADPANADVLRQFETYVPEYDQFGRGDDITGCLLCGAGTT